MWRSRSCGSSSELQCRRPRRRWRSFSERPSKSCVVPQPNDGGLRWRGRQAFNHEAASGCEKAVSIQAAASEAPRRGHRGSGRCATWARCKRSAPPRPLPLWAKVRGMVRQIPADESRKGTAIDPSAAGGAPASLRSQRGVKRQSLRELALGHQGPTEEPRPKVGRAGRNGEKQRIAVPLAFAEAVAEVERRYRIKACGCMGSRLLARQGDDAASSPGPLAQPSGPPGPLQVPKARQILPRCFPCPHIARPGQRKGQSRQGQGQAWGEACCQVQFRLTCSCLQARHDQQACGQFVRRRCGHLAGTYKDAGAVFKSVRHWTKLPLHSSHAQCTTAEASPAKSGASSLFDDEPDLPAPVDIQAVGWKPVPH